MTTAAVAPNRKGFSLETFQESRSARTVFGVILAAAMVGAVALIISSFTGKFTDVIDVRGQLSGAGNTIPAGSLVLYRNVTVGKIGSQGLGPNGTIAVTLELYPSKASQVPSNVQALISPLSIFGNQAIDLVVPTGATAAGDHVTSSTFIQADTQTASVSLQQTTTQLFNLLSAVHPAQLDTALTAFATALNGEGANLGQALRDTDEYLKALNPHLATLNADTALLSPVAAQLNQAAPDVIGALANNTVTANTINANASSLTALLQHGSSAVGQLATLFDAVRVTLPNLLNSSGPVLRDISANPHLFSQTLSGLETFAAAVAASETHGPFLSVNAKLPIYNTTAAVEAALSQGSASQLEAYLAQALGSGNVNPTPYSAADCPRYAGEQNYCGGGTSPATSNVGTNPSASASSRVATDSATTNSATANAAQAHQIATAAVSDPANAELAAVEQIAAALGGGQAPAVPGEASMVLVPLYNAMAAGT